jgi:hypothetical protein
MKSLRWEPLFEEIGSGFRVTLFSKSQEQPQLDMIDRAIVDFIRREKESSTSRVALHISRTSRSARTRLNHLVDIGLLVPISSSSRDPRKVYRLAKE